MKIMNLAVTVLLSEFILITSSRCALGKTETKMVLLYFLY